MDDPHKLLRGQLLDRWVAANGGAARCLAGAGYTPGSREFKARETHLSQSRKGGMGHKAALRYESEFEPLGMRPGELTNDLDARSGARLSQSRNLAPEVEGGRQASVNNFTRNFSGAASNTHRAPIVSWGLMGVDAVFRENLSAGELVAPVDFGDGAVVWRIEDDSMSPDYNPGDFIALDDRPASVSGISAGEAAIFETSTGTKILRYYTPLVDGHFEARPPSGSRYAALSTLQLALRVKAVVQAHLRVRRQPAAKAA